MVTAAILAGGRATRFGGCDKSALVVEGRTIFDRQMAELTQVAGEILFVAPATLQAQPAPRPGVKTVADLMPGCGPLGGLHAALTAARSEAVIVVACDMPYISAPFLSHLASLAGEPVEAGGSGGFVAVVPHTERGYHPLCAVYTRAAIEPIERRLADGRLTMTDLLTDLRLRIVASEEIARFGDPHRLLANVNSPADHRGLEALHNHEV
jgi:molybdopterin-guanine dinucleotide biosynthesis protein A